LSTCIILGEKVHNITTKKIVKGDIWLPYVTAFATQKVQVTLLVGVCLSRVNIFYFFIFYITER
jgi:hypothetical protein